MALYGGPTPKRHFCYSNSPGIARLNLGQLGCRRGRSGANSSEIPWQTGAPSLQRSCGAQTLGVRNLIASKCGSKKQSNLILLRVFHALHCFIHKFLIFKLSPRNYPPGFGEKLVKIFQELITLKQGMPTLPDPVPDAKETFSSMSYDDNWQDADVVSVVHWLRGGRDLAIPEEWRKLLPEKL